EELPEPLAGQAPAFARAQPPHAHVKEKVAARFREPRACSAPRERVDALGDEAVFENLVKARDRGMGNPEILRKRPEAHQASRLEPGELEEAGERTDVAHERLRSASLPREGGDLPE